MRSLRDAVVCVPAPLAVAGAAVRGRANQSGPLKGTRPVRSGYVSVPRYVTWQMCDGLHGVPSHPLTRCDGAGVAEAGGAARGQGDRRERRQAPGRRRRRRRRRGRVCAPQVVGVQRAISVNNWP